MCLVVPPVPMLATVALAPTISFADCANHSVTVDSRLGPFDRAFAYAHELGHLADSVLLSDTERLRFQAVLDVPAEPWSGGRYAISPAEAFATAFAISSCGGPWWAEIWVGAQWGPEDEASVVAACHAVLEEAGSLRPSRR